jgi:hypothetical protein
MASRVFGALRPVAAPTGAAIRGALEVSAPNVRFLRNRRGLFVFERVPGLETQEDAATVSNQGLVPIPITVSLRDPTQQYLARRVTVVLPRDPSPATPLPADSVFSPIDVVLYPSPLASIEPGWAVLRVSVRRAGAGTGLPSAYLRVRRAGGGGEVLARGFTDARGEALVPVAGIPVVNWDSDPEASVLATDINVVLEAFFDVSQVAAGPDPDVIETRLPTLPHASSNLRLASGREVNAALELAVA